MNESTNTFPIAVVIFAHNEAAVIGKTVQYAKKALEEGDALYVIADRCSDETASIARKSGATVFDRESGVRRGKSAAMEWFFHAHIAELRRYFRLAILDADSLIGSDFLHVVREYVKKSDHVFQCVVKPVGYEGSAVSTLIALSEVVEQSVFNRVKAFLGWPVRLRGTGMLISPDLLYAVHDRIQTEVDDIALTLLLAEKNVPIEQITAAEVSDPKPTESSAASRQRARWFRGQWAALWLYRASIGKIMLQGLKGWALISAIFLKPRWLMMFLQFILAILCLGFPLLAIFWGTLFIINVIMIAAGACLSSERGAYLRALLYLPGFVFMWVRSMLLSCRRIAWLRVRETSYPVKVSPILTPQYLNRRSGRSSH